MTNREHSKESDLRQALRMHFQKMPDSPLRSELSRDAEERLAEFDRADAIAIRQQRDYRRFARFALWTMLTGALIGALVLLPIDGLIEGRPRKAIEAIQGLALILTFVAIWWIGLRQSVGQWMQSRAKAERLRAEVFRPITRMGTDAKNLLGPALACFKDAHLHWQLGYFKKRSGQHRQAAGHATPYKIAGYLLLGISIVLGLVGVINFAEEVGIRFPYLTAAVQAYTVPQSGRWQTGLGAMASSILAFASARTFMDQDDRNASCYELAAKELERIKKDDLSKAEAAAEVGNAADVMAFCEKVQAVLSAEHSSWTFMRPPSIVTVTPEP